MEIRKTRASNVYDSAKRPGSRAPGIISGVVIFIFPIISFVLFEYVTGNLGTLIPYRAMLNIGWYYVFYMVLFAVCGTSRITVPVLSAFFYLLSLAETFVVDFRARPIMLWDVFAIRTAASVAGNYDYYISPRMALAFIILLAANVFVWRFPLRLRGIRARLTGLVCLAAASAAYVLWFFLYYTVTWHPGINTWDPNLTYNESGYIYSTVVSLGYVIKDPPEGYSYAAVEEIYGSILELSDDSEGFRERYGFNSGAEGTGGGHGADDAGTGGNGLSAPGSGDGTGAVSSFDGTAVGSSGDGTGTLSLESASAQDASRADSGTVPVNIICIMNESLSELRAAGDFTTNTGYFPFLNSLTDNTVKGSLVVPVFGSMTSCSEFEFLTGDSVTMLTYNSSPYLFNVKPGALTLVSTLKEQGYRAVAMHPFLGGNWNRDTVYANMGFDEFMDIEDYEDPELLREYVSDRADFEKILETVRAKEDPDEQLFVFNVTMQNHGGYEFEYDNFPQEVWLTGDLEGLYPMTDQYLSLMKASDDAFKYLLESLSEIDEPTMVVMFGDHQPSVEDEFYNDIAGMDSSEVPASEWIMWYETPFIIWTNYEMPSEDLGRLSAPFLSSEMLKRSGLGLTPYNDFLLGMNKLLPIVHWYGCYDSEGNYYTWDEIGSEDNPYYSLMLDYEYLVYNHSFDRKKLEELFRVEQ